MTLPECTVIIPVYNSERFIKRTVRSVLNQTFVDFELIAIDDCSTDQSYEILLTLAKSDGRIRSLEMRVIAVQQNPQYRAGSSTG